ncbi:MAG: phosphatase PAP2 family protein [Oscillospiraceae bacterium]|nr:phosphatase PAP2 family protein [Oscillospiraceae bacterium]
MIEILRNLDANALLYIQDFLRTPFLTPFMVFFSKIGNMGIVWIVTGLLLLIPKRTRRGGFDMLLCLIAAYAVNDLLVKPLVGRARPYETIEGLRILVSPLSSYSFPSGHTNSSFASAIALTLAFGKKGALAYIPAVLIAFSRCYVGVHYPSDVFAGMIVGTLTALLTYLLLHKYVKTDLIGKKKE